MKLQACHCCGQIHRLPPLSPAQSAHCTRCGARINQPAEQSASRTAAAATAALILFWPAILLPILHIEKFGNHHQSSLLAGTIELLRQGDWFVGTVVLLFSIVFPLLKIVFLLELSVLGFPWPRAFPRRRGRPTEAGYLPGKMSAVGAMAAETSIRHRHRARTYRMMELAGKWSMMDVLLLAFLVMLVKLGSMVQFSFGPAVVAFVGCVAMSLLASLCFDPHTIWGGRATDQCELPLGEC